MLSSINNVYCLYYPSAVTTSVHPFLCIPLCHHQPPIKHTTMRRCGGIRRRFYLYFFFFIQTSTYKYLLDSIKISWIFRMSSARTVLLYVRIPTGMRGRIADENNKKFGQEERGWLYFYRDVLGIGIVNNVSHSKQIVKRSYIRSV